MKNFWRTALCLLVLLFGMSASHAQMMYKAGLTDPGFKGLRFWVDANGDGKDDFCIFTGGSTESMDCFMAGNGTFGDYQRFANTGTGGLIGSIMWGDVNGDGYQDVCRGAPGDPNDGGVSTTLTCSLGPDFVQKRVATIPLTTINNGIPTTFGLAHWDRVYMADVNGDGRTDICYIVSKGTSLSALRCQLATDTGFSGEATAWSSQTFDKGYDDWVRGLYDFNGDGTPDFCRVLGGGVISCLLITQAGITSTDVATQPIANPSGSGGAAFVDINGDGNTDYCRVVNGTVSCVLSDGTKWLPTEYASTALDPGDSSARYWVDINGDGLPDFCRIVSGNTMSCRVGKGVSAAQPWPLMFSDLNVVFNTTDEAGPTDGGRQFCDPNGTGINTFCRMVIINTAAGQICWTNDYGQQICTGTIYAHTWSLMAGLTDVATKPAQALQPVLTVFSDGLGAETHLTYLPMSNTDIYTHTPVGALTGAYPRSQITKTGRTPLVYESRVWRTSNQTPLSGNARYFFKDARSDWQTGSLGFRERWIFNESSNSLDHVVNFQGLGPTVDTSSIANDWREVGQVKFEERYTVANGLLPNPQNTVGISARQATLNTIGSVARTMSAVTVGNPTTASPFILLSTTTNTLGDVSLVGVDANPLPAAWRPRFVSGSTTRSWDWTGSSLIELPKNDTTTTMDSTGNIRTLVQRTLQPDGTIWQRVTTTNSFQDDGTNWLLGRMTHTSVKTEAASAADQLALYPNSAGRLPGAATISSSVPASPQTTSPAVIIQIINSILLSD